MPDGVGVSVPSGVGVVVNNEFLCTPKVKFLTKIYPLLIQDNVTDVLSFSVCLSFIQVNSRNSLQLYFWNFYNVFLLNHKYNVIVNFKDETWLDFWTFKKVRRIKLANLWSWNINWNC